MKRVAFAAAMLFVTPLFAEDVIRVGVHETIALQVIAVTAAYAVDSSIADATVNGHELIVVGRSSGETQLVLVTPAGTRMLRVEVRAMLSAPPPQQSARAGGGVVASRYTSSVGQIQNTVELTGKTGDRETRVHAVTLNRLGERGGDSAAALPSVSASVITPEREVTLLDRAVGNSSLTLDNTIVRGLHFIEGPWRLHAGVTAPGFLDRFILPADRETVIGAAYAWRLTPSSTLKPGFFHLHNGSIASLVYQFARGDELQASAEIAASHGLGGAFDIVSNRPREMFRASLRWQPREFATAGPIDRRGLYSDLAWSGELGRRFTADVSASVTHPMLPHFEQRSVTSSGEMRFRASKSLTFFGGASYGSFTAIVPTGTRIRSIIVPVGVSADFARAGGSVTLRGGTSSGNGSMRGFRVTGRASLGRVSANAWIDRQSDVPTLSVIFRERPDLALALEEMGISAATPADIARLLRDEAPLIEHGFVQSATINLAARHTQGGLEMSWFGGTESRQQLRLRLLRNRIDGVASSTTSSIASLTYSQRVTASTSVEASCALWRLKSHGQSERTPSIEVALRHTFDGLPQFGGGRGVVSGLVFADEEITGVSTGNGIAGIDVELDAGERTRTDEHGRFQFRKLDPRIHRLTVHLPSADAYFTTPSRVEASAGDVVNFGLAHTPARLIGRVVGDAGTGVGTVRVSITRGAQRLSATTASDGRFEIVAPPGSWQAAIDRDSLPFGYSADATNSREVVLQRGQPQSLDFRVEAARSVSGRIAAAGRVPVEVLIQPGERRVIADAEGHYAVRSLPAGTITIVVRGETRSIVLSPEPVAMHDVDFGVAANPAPQLSAARLSSAPPVPSQRALAWIVQLGAFRQRANVDDTVRRASAAGIAATTREGTTLTFVQAGPFSTRASAEQICARATSRGLDAAVAVVP